eukprot:403340491
MSDTALESGDLKLINNKLSIIEEEQANQGQFEEQQHILNNEQTDNLTQPNSQNSDQQYQNMKHQNFKNKKPQNFKQKLHQNLNQQYLNQLDSNEDQNDSSLKNLQIKKSKTYHEKVNQSRNAQEQNNIDKNQNSQQKLNEKQQFQEIQTLPLLPIKTPIDSLQYTCDIYQDVSSLNNIKFDATFKLILIGNSGVGKSCIIKRIGHNKFSEEHEVTIGAEFTTIACQLNRKSFMKMQFWDSCGQERFNSITRIFYRGSSCVLLVYEVNSMQSLRDLEQIWIDDIQSSLKDAILILVGNKADIDDNAKHKYKRQVTQEEGLQFMEKHNLNYFTEAIIWSITDEYSWQLISNLYNWKFYTRKHVIEKSIHQKEQWWRRKFQQEKFKQQKQKFHNGSSLKLQIFYEIWVGE